MARARPDQAAAFRQLTLDDWEQMLSASPEAPQSPRRGAPNGDTPASVGPAEKVHGARGESSKASEKVAVLAATRHRSVAPELLETPGALLTRTHLRELGLERRAVDAVFRALPVVALPGYSRPLIRAQDYLQLAEEYTYRDDRVRPSAAAMTRRLHGA